MDASSCFTLNHYPPIHLRSHNHPHPHPRQDAEIGARELDLAYMTGKERLHVGFPEGGYAKYAERLVRLGYKVGRVEQVSCGCGSPTLSDCVSCLAKLAAYALLVRNVSAEFPCLHELCTHSTV